MNKGRFPLEIVFFFFGRGRERVRTEDGFHVESQFVCLFFVLKGWGMHMMHNIVGEPVGCTRLAFLPQTRFHRGEDGLFIFNGWSLKDYISLLNMFPPRQRSFFSDLLFWRCVIHGSVCVAFVCRFFCFCLCVDAFAVVHHGKTHKDAGRGNQLRYARRSVCVEQLFDTRKTNCQGTDNSSSVVFVL